MSRRQSESGGVKVVENGVSTRCQDELQVSVDSLGIPNSTVGCPLTMMAQKALGYCQK